MAFFILLSVLSLAVPFVMAFFIARHSAIPIRNVGLFLLVGIGGWMIAKIPKGVLILPIFIMKGLPLQMEANQLEEFLRTDISLLLVTAIAAGIFEEVCKPLGLLLFKSKLNSAGASIGWIVGPAPG